MRDNRGWSWLFHRGGMSTHTCPMRGRTCGRTGGLAGAHRFGEQLASVGRIRRAMPLARLWLRYRLRQWLCYRRCYEWLRMTPARRAFRECRMQFPRHCVSPRNHIVGIATFADMIESSFNRIACETASRMCACTHVGPMARTRARHFARGPGGMRVGPMVCVWAAPRRISRG